MSQKYAIILAAGIGSRLRPLTDIMPKSLVKVQDREIIDYQIQGYIKSGILENNIFVVTGYKSEMIEAFLKNKYPTVNMIQSIDYDTTNNMYSLYLALKEIQKTTQNNFDQVFINNADCLYAEELMLEFVNCEYENAIASDLGEYIDESMKITLEENKIINIAKTTSLENSAGVSVDLYKFSKSAILSLFEIIKDFIEVKKDLKQWTEVAFPPLFKIENVYPFNIKNKKWVEVDNNEDLLTADKLFSDFDLKKKKAIICDMDGTLYVGNNPISKAIEFIKRNSKNIDFYYLTNNTSKTPEMYVEKLKLYGIETSVEKITTPLYPLIDKIKEEKLDSIYLIANEVVTSFLKKQLPNVSFDYSLEKNKAVVLTYDTEITYEKLKNITILLNRKNIQFIATHTDIFCPHESGPIPDIGSILELIKKTNGKEPNCVLGKPSTKLIEWHLKNYGSEKIAIVGDRLYTDKKLADNANCDFICVLSGETTRLDVARYNGKYPSIVLNDLGDIL